jgi:hypothetical protein
MTCKHDGPVCCPRGYLKNNAVGKCRVLRGVELMPVIILETLLVVIEFFFLVVLAFGPYLTGMMDIGQRIKSQGALLKETLNTLNEIQAALFDIRQGELFDNESTETFEQLREITPAWKVKPNDG